jgi:hypothetical protein
MEPQNTTCQSPLVLLNLLPHDCGFFPKKGSMDRQRLLELALETLEIKRAEIERSIAEVREFQEGKRRASARNPEKTIIVEIKRRTRTRAQRKAQSERMTKIWAARKEAPRPAVAAKIAPAIPKRRPKTVAEKKALSLKMKQVWAKKKAQAKKA